MRKILRLLPLILILNLINSQIGKADQQIQFGTRVNIYKGPWNNLTPLNGIKHYTVKNIPSSFQVAIQFTNFDANTATVILNNLYCSVDPNVTDFDTAPNTGKFTNVTFSYNGVAATSNTISLAGGQVFNSGGTVITPTLPCSSITFEFSTATQVATNVEIVATFSGILLNQTGINGSIGGNGTGGVSTNVQGMSASQTNGNTINPIVDGGLGPATNAQFFSGGVDTFSSGQQSIPALVGPPGAPFSFNVPNPSLTNEWVYAALGPLSGTVNTINPTFTCIEASCTSGSGISPVFKSLTANNNNILNGTVTNAASTYQAMVNFVVYNKPPTIRQHLNTNAASPALPSNSLVGSRLQVSILCNATPCAVGSITDTQGNTWVQVTSVVSSTGVGSGGLSTWVTTTNTTAAADTLTITMSAGTNNQQELLELTGFTPANLNQPLTPNQLDPSGRQVTSPDAIGANQFTLSITLTTNTTTQIVPIPASINCGTLSNGTTFTCRNYITDIQLNTTVAGTATTIQLKDGTGANCGTGTANLSAILYPNTTVGITNIIGVRTPLGAPAGTAVCATQAGTTPGTTLIEVRGFIAP